MKNAKKRRKISKKESIIIKWLVIFLVTTLTLILFLYIESVSFSKYLDSSIEMYKEEAYSIYNYGLKNSDYRTIKIKTRNVEDMDRVFNVGVKEVVRKDLLKMELIESYYKINYKDGCFYFFDLSKIKSIKIIIDPVNSDDISSYTYKEHIKLKAIVVRMLLGYIIIMLFYWPEIMIKSKDKNNQNHGANTE